MTQVAHETTSGSHHVDSIGSSGSGQELLTFTLGKEEYGIEILKVQEIRGYEAVTTIPNSPDYIKGVINLRGVIVPIVDLRIKFNLGSAEYNQFTVVIILSVANRVVGVVVDSVSDVLALTNDQLRPPPELGTTMDASYIVGLGALQDRMLILVDIERLITSRDLGLMDQSVQ
jgi:purine-binding chemotaxis protein CheW